MIHDLGERGEAPASPLLAEPPPIGRYVVALRRAAAGAAGSAGVVASLVVLGWLFDVPLLKTGLVGGWTVKPTTGLAVVLTALSYWLLRDGQTRPMAHLAGKGCAATAGALAALTLAEYLLQRDLLLHNLVVRDGAGDPSHSARMAVTTALGLFAANAGLLLLTGPKARYRSGQLCGLAAASIGFVAVVGHLTQVPALYGIGTVTRMPLPTAVCLTLLGVALMLARPDRGPAQLLITASPGGTMVRRLLPAAVAIPPVLAALVWQGHRGGLYGTEAAVFVVTTSVIALFIVVVWALAGSADRADRARRQAEHAARIGDRRLDDERRRAAEEIDQFFALSLDPLCIAGSDGYFKRVNPAWERVLGYTVEELTSRPYQDFVHPDDIARTLAARDRLAAGAAAVSFENRYHRKDGSYRWLLWNVAPAPGRSLVYAAARDITDRKETEHALAVARDQAVQATQLKSQFLATMSHEIRTPINGVIGLTSLLLETQLDRTQRRYAEGVRIAGDTLLSLINDILDFSKIEAGKIILDEIDFEPRRLVEEVTEVVAGTARAKDLELIGYCEPDVPCVVAGDENRIRQILLNLASNAVKFTHEGEVVISADLLDRPAPEARHVTVRFEVRDTGIGIAAADTERLFEAFSQADASTTRTHGGTGLGLAISRRLAELMGGEIGVESEPGKGSRFWCTLPLRLRSMNGSAQRFSDAGLDGLRVLIVDDNATNRLVLEQQLLAWRMNPTATDTGDDALARLRAAAVAGNPFDVAILDMHMPVMDGAELARRITADPDIPPVHLALASSGADIDAAAAASAGVACRLTKPVHQSQLFECLARVTEPAPATEPARAEGAERVAPANGSRGHVLLVEDNEVNQTVGLGMLARLGYTADVANNGVEALEKLAHSSYDAVLMDGQMPKMDGFEATAEIRRREKPGDHVPVIAMTAAAFAEDRARCLAAGMDDYISKPISRDALDTVLSRWITERDSD